MEWGTADRARKISLCLIKHNTAKAHRGRKVKLQEFLTCALDDGGKWSASGFGHIIPRPHWIGVWLGARVGLDV